MLKHWPSLKALPLPLLEGAMVLAWSSGFVGARYSIDQAPAFLVVFWRCLLLSLLLLPWAWSALRTMPLRPLLRQAAIGFLAMTGYLAGVVQGIALGVPAGLAALIADLLPLGTALLATGFGQQRLPAMGWLGLGLGLAGVLVVTQDALQVGAAPLWAYALPLLGMLSLALATLWKKATPADHGVGLWPNLWVQCAVSTLCFGVACLFDTGLAPVASLGFVYSVGWTAAVSTLGGYGLYWVCLNRSSPTRVASVLYLSPAVTMAWAWAMFDEPLSWAIAAGLVLSALGITLVIRGERQPPVRLPLRALQRN
jgi:drug/metabolite transporter (DMT)-like permease